MHVRDRRRKVEKVEPIRSLRSRWFDTHKYKVYLFFLTQFDHSLFPKLNVLNGSAKGMFSAATNYSAAELSARVQLCASECAGGVQAE